VSALPSHSLVPVGAADIVDAYLVRVQLHRPLNVQRHTVLVPREKGARRAFLWAGVESERIVSARYSFIGIR